MSTAQMGPKGKRTGTRAQRHDLRLTLHRLFGHNPWLPAPSTHRGCAPCRSVNVCSAAEPSLAGIKPSAPTAAQPSSLAAASVPATIPDAPTQHASPEAVVSAPSKAAKRKKPRLDEVCMTLRPDLSRNVIQSFILQNKVTVDGKVVNKAGTPVSPTAKVVISGEELKYVCRAGFKLERALDHFEIDPTGLVCLDSGLSTGGFTDCLLQRGAAHVYGVDVGYGQVHDKVRRDARVTVIERYNVRHLKPADIPQKVDLVTLDLSFISVLKVLPAVVRVMTPHPHGQMVVLIKPQFEAGRAQVSSGGVVRDPRVHREVIARVTDGVSALGFTCKGVIESPLKGDKSGNTEFLAHYVRDPSRVVTESDLDKLVDDASHTDTDTDTETRTGPSEAQQGTS